MTTTIYHKFSMVEFSANNNNNKHIRSSLPSISHSPTSTDIMLPKKRGRPCTRRVDPFTPQMTITRTEIVKQFSNSIIVSHDRLLPYENTINIHNMQYCNSNNSNSSSNNSTSSVGSDHSQDLTIQLKRKRSSHENMNGKVNIENGNIDPYLITKKTKPNLISSSSNSGSHVQQAFEPSSLFLATPSSSLSTNNSAFCSVSDEKRVISPQNRKVIRTSISIKELLN